MTIIHRSNHTAHVARTGRASVRRSAVAGRLAGDAVAAALLLGALLLGAPVLATVTAAPAAADPICNPFTQVCLPNLDAPLGPWVPWEPAPASEGLSPAVPIQIEVENIPAAPAPPPAAEAPPVLFQPHRIHIPDATANNQPVPGTMFLPDAAAAPPPNGGLSPAVPIQIEVENIPAAPAPPPAPSEVPLQGVLHGKAIQ